MGDSEISKAYTQLVKGQLGLEIAPNVTAVLDRDTKLLDREQTTLVLRRFAEISRSLQRNDDGLRKLPSAQAESLAALFSCSQFPSIQMALCVVGLSLLRKEAAELFVGACQPLDALQQWLATVKQGLREPNVSSEQQGALMACGATMLKLLYLLPPAVTQQHGVRGDVEQLAAEPAEDMIKVTAEMVVEQWQKMGR